MEPSENCPVSQPVDRDDRLEYRRLDAGRRRRLVDDVAFIVAVDGGPGGGRRQLPVDAPCAAGGRSRRHCRSPAAADRHSNLPDDCRWRARHHDPARPDDRMGADRLRLRPRGWLRNDDASVGCDRPRSGPRRRHARRHRAEQHRHQRIARDRTGDCRRAGGGGGRVAGVRAQCAVVHRHPCRAAAMAARASQEHACRPSAF